jgi:hypothetical protein
VCVCRPSRILRGASFAESFSSAASERECRVIRELVAEYSLKSGDWATAPAFLAMPLMCAECEGEGGGGGGTPASFGGARCEHVRRDTE